MYKRDQKHLIMHMSIPESDCITVRYVSMKGRPGIAIYVSCIHYGIKSTLSSVLLNIYKMALSGIKSGLIHAQILINLIITLTDLLLKNLHRSHNEMALAHQLLKRLRRIMMT